jgi:hypothetical protein
LKVQAAYLEDYASTLIAAALASTLSDAKPRSTLAEHAVHQFAEARAASSLRAAASI